MPAAYCCNGRQKNCGENSQGSHQTSHACLHLLPSDDLSPARAPGPIDRPRARIPKDQLFAYRNVCSQAGTRIRLSRKGCQDLVINFGYGCVDEDFVCLVLVRPVIASSSRHRICATTAGRKEARESSAASALPARPTAPPQPAPRNAEGRVTSSEVRRPHRKDSGCRSSVSPTRLHRCRPCPFKPWARAVYDDRQEHELEPHTRCKPSGVARQFLTPYGVEFVELPELQRLYIFDVGGPHTYRTVYMDGRSHPAKLRPSLLRSLDRLVGGRHARHRHHRFQRGLLARPSRAATHRQASHSRAIHPRQCGGDSL